MTIKTLFGTSGHFELGEVEFKLLPGLPQLQMIGRPDVGLRECAVKLKSALKSAGLKWPAGQKLVVNLRPAHLTKVSAGAELAIAMGFLRATRQLAPQIEDLLKRTIVYGELGLDGQVFAPGDFEAALLEAGETPLLSGRGAGHVREGRWFEFDALDTRQVWRREKKFAWDQFWVPPPEPTHDLSLAAARALELAVHAELSVLLAGPPGTGKSTWARTLHALTPPPSARAHLELARLLGAEAWETRWRPLLQPHHTSSALAIVGGGAQLKPGILSRAHGGVLILDEFLEFSPRVQEALREPMDTGWIELARGSRRERWPCHFQLLATTNLCPCGRMVPGFNKACGYNLGRCQSVWQRLRGPVLDRFDVILFSGEWLKGSVRVPVTEIRERLGAANEFRRARDAESEPAPLPETFTGLGLSHRRLRALQKTARALADFDQARRVTERHIFTAAEWVIDPLSQLRQLFG